MLPPSEHPEVFGLHPNANIASQIAETKTLFDTLLSLRPQVSSPSAAGSGPSQEEKVRGKQGGQRGGGKRGLWGRQNVSVEWKSAGWHMTRCISYDILTHNTQVT